MVKRTRMSSYIAGNGEDDAEMQERVAEQIKNNQGW